MKTVILVWVLRLTAAIILLQTLYFKFSGAAESVYIFSILGIEPYGRIGLGIIELITAILILVPRTTWLGAFIGCGIMIGAILSHFFVLGITVQNDGGLLFGLASITFLCCLVLVFFNKSKFLNLRKIQY
jgi:hypothetical protein